MLLQNTYIHTGKDNVFPNHIDINYRNNPAYELLENNETRPTKIGSLDIIYSDTELGDFFDNIKKHFNGVSFSLILIANKHAINLNYIHETDQWLLIDANNMPGHRYLKTNFLVKQIMKSLFYQRGYILVETLFYSLKKNQSNVSKCFNQFKSSIERSDTGYFHRTTLSGSSLLRNSIKRKNWQEMCDLISKGAVLCDEDMQDLLTILQSSSAPERLIDDLYEQLVYKDFYLLLRCIELLIPDKIKVNAYLLKKFSNLSDDAIEKIHTHFDGFKCLSESIDFLINHIDFFSDNLRLNKYFVNLIIGRGWFSLDEITKLHLLKHTKFQPTLEIVHLMIINEALDILSFYKSRGFIFKSEHLNALGRDLSGVYVDDLPLSFEVVMFFWDMGIKPEASIIARLIRNNQVNDVLVKLKDLGFKFESNHLNVFHQHYNMISISPEVMGFFWSMGIQPSNGMVNRLIYQNQLTAIVQLRNLGFIFNSYFLEQALRPNTSEIFLFLVKQNIKLEQEIIKQYILCDNNLANMVEHYPFFDPEHLTYALWCRSTSFILPLLKKNIQLGEEAVKYMSSLLRSLVGIINECSTESDSDSDSDSDYLSDSDCWPEYKSLHDRNKNTNNKYKTEYSNILQYLINQRPVDYHRVSLHLKPAENLILFNHSSLNSSGLGFFGTKSNSYLAEFASTVTNSL